MPIKELWDSYKEDDTSDGWTVERHFVCTWSEWADNGGVLWGVDEDGEDVIEDGQFSFPVVGDSLFERPDLVVVHRHANAMVQDTVFANITILYSTRGLASRAARQNQIKSWEESMDISLEESIRNRFLDKDDTVKDWKDLWSAGIAGNNEENMPDLAILTPRIVMTITAFSDVTYRTKILTNIGRINSDLLLNYIAEQKQLVDPDRSDDVDGGFNDINAWMFYGATSKRVRVTSIQYAFSFVYAAQNWQKLGSVTHNAYKEFSIAKLMDGFNSIDADFHDAPRT